MADRPAAAGVLLIAPVPPPYGGMALQAKRLEGNLLQDGCHVAVLPSNFELPGWMGILRRIPGIRTCIRALLIWGKLWRQMETVQIVHIFAASGWYFALVVCPAVIVGRIRRKRTVLNYRGGHAPVFFRRFGWAIAWCFRAAAVVTAPSGFIGETIRNHFAIPSVIVPNLVDLSKFRYRQRTRVTPKLLVTRHLEEIYDVESVIRAFQIIKARHSNAILWIAGTGSQEEYLRNLVATSGLRNVEFLGHIAQEDLPAIYDQCDICINASLVDNFPGALLEASASGLPIVSSWAGGIPFIYEDGVSALLRRPGDWHGLAEAVDELLQSPALAMKLSTQGVSIARKCDWTSVRQPLYEAYGLAPVEAAAGVVSEG